MLPSDPEGPTRRRRTLQLRADRGSVSPRADLKNHQLLAAMKKGRKSPNLPQDEGAPPLFWVLSQNVGAPPLFEGAPPLLWVLSTTNKHLSTSPNLPPPTCLQHQLIPPPPLYLGQGGTTHPSTPFDLKSSIETSWPRDGFLTTSQAITMNPRSQWSLFEFGK